MRTEELNYKLPGELIAQKPADNRSDSRLLVMERASNLLTDTVFNRIGEYLRAGDCLVLNDTKVLAARFFARRKSGAKLEGLFLKENGESVWEVLLKGSNKVRIGEEIYLGGDEGDSVAGVLLEKLEEGKCVIRIGSDQSAENVLERIGYAPLPPYIKRGFDKKIAEMDKSRYQTVYAQEAGAVAAPTAGMHFTNGLIEQLRKSGIKFAYITLHVGMGTFKPVKAENLEEHEIHEERFSIDEENAEIINNTKKEGGRIIAVGTTSVRTLETITKDSKVVATNGTTKLFIQPGYKFKMIDGMVTNFHLPKSTLLALVGAFAGLENILAAYRHAIEKRYRFYSYGDAMLII